MDGATLKKSLVEIYGEEFHETVAAEVGVDKSTVYRWVGLPAVPGLVCAWITNKKQLDKISKKVRTKEKAP